MAITLRAVGQDIWARDWMLRGNPWRQSEIFSVDRESTYVPEIYGAQFDEFYKKFFLMPLSQEKNRQVIGGVWSTDTGDTLGKGYGKSFLMYQESREINVDFGASKLRRFEISENDIAENPVVAGYCTFDQSKDVKSFPAAILDAISFILESKHGSTNVHAALRERATTRVDAEDGFESESIFTALHKELRKYRGLNIQLTHASIERFIQKLCSSDTGELVNFIRHEIGPRIKSAQGFNFVHVFNAFLNVCGVVYVTYFVDQIETFARFARNQERDLKILRESICQTSPTDSIASFVFQMHVHALQTIEGWWDNIEHLPSLDPKKPINSTRIVYLKGLTTRAEAEILARRYLADNRISDAKPPHALHPFDSDIVEAVRQSVKGNPRHFGEKLGAILNNAFLNQHPKIDLPFVTPLLEDDAEGISFSEEEDAFGNPDR